MTENSLPEEKLLRLIRKDGKKQAGAVPAAAPAGSVFSGSRLNRKLVSFFTIRSAVLVFFVLSCVYFLSAVAYPFVGLKKLNLVSAAADKNRGTRAAAQIQVKPFQYYKDGIAGRQVFKIAGQGTAESPASAGAYESIQDFSLLGIISGDKPQAIIQDNKTQKTYTVNKGQFVGEYSVEEILPDKVILNSTGQRYELFL